MIGTLPSVAFRTPNLVGRRDELELIRKAIQDESKSLRVLHFVGGGGLGKTRLLEEVPKLLGSLENRERYHYVGLFDFYRTDLHTSRGLAGAAIKEADPDTRYFQAFRKRQLEYWQRRKDQAPQNELRQFERELPRLFIEDFNKLTSKVRAIFCFDTAEALQYESDLVQETLGIPETGFEDIKTGLRDLGGIKNAVFIVAGRPNPTFERDLGRFFGDRYIHGELGPFLEHETGEYLNELARANPELYRDVRDGVDARVIHHYTGGEPLRLSLALDHLANSGTHPLAQLLQTYAELQKRPSSEAEMNQTRDQIELDLVSRIKNSILERKSFDALNYLALARTGMNATLLSRVTGWSEEDCQSTLTDLQRFSFVKPRHGTDLIFLHDEMYELMDRVAHPESLPNFAAICQKIREYHDEQIQKASDPLGKLALQVDRVYYDLLENPLTGYSKYSRLVTEAIIAGETEFDMSLQHQLLSFINRPGNERRDALFGLTRDMVDRDLAVRWVMRKVVHGDREEALGIADRVTSSFLAQDVDDPYYNALLSTYKGEAMVYLGKEQALPLLEEAIAAVENLHPEDDYKVWNRKHILGRAHNDIGFEYRRRLDLTHAREEYEKAIPFLREAGLTILFADTLKNVAYVNALLGADVDAITSGERVIDICEERGFRHPKVLAMNTLAEIFVEFEHPIRATKTARAALDLAEELQDQRAIGLACITLGHALRRTRALGLNTFDENEKNFDEAHKLQLRAISIFDTETNPDAVNEPVRWVAALHELGRVYRDWAESHAERDPNSPQAKRYWDQAEENLEKARDRTTSDMMLVRGDILEDWAEVKVDRGDLEGAEAYLKEAEAQVPEEYRFVDGQRSNLDNPIVRNWNLLGKVSFRRGSIAATRDDFASAIREYVLADVYFQAMGADRDIPLRLSINHMRNHLQRANIEQISGLRGVAEQEYQKYHRKGKKHVLHVLNLL